MKRVAVEQALGMFDSVRRKTTWEISKQVRTVIWDQERARRPGV